MRKEWLFDIITCTRIDQIDVVFGMTKHNVLLLGGNKKKVAKYTTKLIILVFL